MHVSYFTERPYRWLDEELPLASRSFFGISNAHFDAQHAADDYNAFLDEFVRAEELGFDGVVLNEHHANPYCLGNVMNIEAAILARTDAMFDQLDAELARTNGPWFSGASYGALDPYVLMLARWSRGFKRPARTLPHLGPYLQRVLARPATQRVFEREELAQPFV